MPERFDCTTLAKKALYKYSSYDDSVGLFVDQFIVRSVGRIEDRQRTHFCAAPHASRPRTLSVTGRAGSAGRPGGNRSPVKYGSGRTRAVVICLKTER